MDAETCVARQQTCMYPVVPTMRGVHAELMVQVITELSAFYGNEKQTLPKQFAWMMLLLDRNSLHLFILIKDLRHLIIDQI
jgi:hypothetical protein